MVFSDPNNTNSIAYQHTLLSYWLKTSHWNISWVATLHLYNMADRAEKLQQPHCYHLFSDSGDTYLTKDHYENYSPKMVPTNPTGSWTTMCDSLWQRPLDNVASTRVVWYYNRPIGVNTLATFMRRLSEKVLCPKHTATILFMLLGWLSFASFVLARNKLCPCPATNLCRWWLCMSASQTRTKCSWVIPSQLYWLVYPLPSNQHSRFFSSHFLQPWPRPVQLRQHLWQAAQQSLTLQMWSNRLPSPPPCPRP